MLCVLAALFLGAVSGAPLAALTATAPDAAVVTIAHADVIVSDALIPPPADAAWQTVALPHRDKRSATGALATYWYKIAFPSADPRAPLWLYFSRLPTGGSIFLNGERIAEIPTANAALQVRWYRPHLLLLPPMGLHAGQNMLAVRLTTREPLTSFGVVRIGPEGPLRTKYDLLYFWETTAAEISAAVCILAGVLILMFWRRRPQEKLYGLFGSCVLFWGARTLLLQVTMLPMPLLTQWRWLYYFTTAGFIVLITVFMLTFSARASPRLTRLMTAYWMLGCLAFALVGMSLRPLMSDYWLPGFLPFTLYAVAQLCWFALRNRTRASLAMGSAVAFALVLTLHDYVVQEGWLQLREIYLMHLAIPSFLLVMAGVLSDRFLDSLDKVESVNHELARQVAAREREIAASYERMRVLERIHAATEERQRIMQDMHDGVGSQLMTTLVMVERGSADRQATVLLLQECLDDMRLAIDSLSPDEPDLLPVLGNFRFRMESRFRSMGLGLEWRTENLPDTLAVAPHTGLHVLRMLQEALVNVLKHARARHVTVRLHFQPHAIGIHVIDDGVGFVPAAGTGFGLNNMRSRAGKIGASFEVEAMHPGTAIHITIPLSVARPADDRLAGAARSGGPAPAPATA